MTTTTQVLDCPMDNNEAGAATVRDYLKTLLLKVWEEDEGFDGKRPFGDSGWQYEVYSALGKAGLITWTLDGNGYVVDCDTDAADRLILDAIRSL